jgi:hypothetical protein
MVDIHGWGRPGICWPIKPIGYWVMQDDGEWELKVRTVIEVCFAVRLHCIGQNSRPYPKICISMQESGFEPVHSTKNSGLHWLETEESIARKQLAQAEEERRRQAAFYRLRAHPSAIKRGESESSHLATRKEGDHVYTAEKVAYINEHCSGAWLKRIYRASAAMHTRAL